MPLKKEEIANFKKRLEEMRQQTARTLQDIKREMAQTDELTGYSSSSENEGTDDFVRNVNLEVTNKEFNLLRQIDRALEKIEEGTYGICDVSGEEISLPRLEAIPYATMTVQAQQKLEKGLL